MTRIRYQKRGREIQTTWNLLLCKRSSAQPFVQINMHRAKVVSRVERSHAWKHLLCRSPIEDQLIAVIIAFFPFLSLHLWFLSEISIRTALQSYIMVQLVPWELGIRFDLPSKATAVGKRDDESGSVSFESNDVTRILVSHCFFLARTREKSIAFLPFFRDPFV